MSDRDSICASTENPRHRYPTTHGEFGTRLHKVWDGMKQRCLNPRCRAFKNYGGRGISVCREWLQYEPFRDWAKANGYSDTLQIDRIDNDGNYEPSNCRFVTCKTNSRNTRAVRLLVAFGESKCITDWAMDQRCLVSRLTLGKRIKAGWEPEQAMTFIEPRSEFAKRRKRSARGEFA